MLGSLFQIWGPALVRSRSACCRTCATARGYWICSAAWPELDLQFAVAAAKTFFWLLQMRSLFLIARAVVVGLRGWRTGEAQPVVRSPQSPTVWAAEAVAPCQKLNRVEFFPGDFAEGWAEAAVAVDGGPEQVRRR